SGNGLSGFAQHAGMAAVGGAAAGAGAGEAAMLLGPAAQDAGVTDKIAWGALRGGVGGAAGSAVQSAINPMTWNGHWEDVAGRFGQNATIGAFQGALLG